MARKKVIGGRYELEEPPLGRGGMAEVYVGRDIKLEREVAVKFVRFPDNRPDPELVRRFVRESRITARLEHPGVPAVYDVGTHEDRPYLVMQRVRGISVSDLVAEQGPLPIGWAAAIAAQACSVLSVAHRESLVHRDLKPSNLMLCPDGTLKVLDFGLAVALDRPDFSQITHTGVALGTPAYMAPEQIEANLSTPRTDLYGLGCTLYEMLTGHQVFSGSTPYMLMRLAVEHRPRPVRERRPEVPPELDRLVSELLEKRPEDRPRDADEVFARLLPFVRELTPLPGALDPPSAPNAMRMYADVVSRVHVDGRAGQRAGVAADGPPAASTAATTTSGVAGQGRVGTSDDVAERAASDDLSAQRKVDESTEAFSRSDLERARKEANSLVRESRYSQAAEILAEVVGPASRVLGPTDPDVISVRMELATVMFEGADYRRAAPIYHQLANDLRDSANVELAFRCRLQEATCHALLGRTSLALRQLRSLLDDELAFYGPDDPAPLEIRWQIGLLQLGAGRREEAHATLRELLDDMVRLHGPDHPPVAQIRELLDGPGTRRA